MQKNSVITHPENQLIWCTGNFSFYWGIMSALNINSLPQMLISCTPVRCYTMWRKYVVKWQHLSLQLSLLLLDCFPCSYGLTWFLHDNKWRQMEGDITITNAGSPFNLCWHSGTKWTFICWCAIKNLHTHWLVHWINGNSDGWPKTLTLFIIRNHGKGDITVLY